MRKQRSSETYLIGSGGAAPSSWKAAPSQVHACLSLRPPTVCCPESRSVASQFLHPSTAPNSRGGAGHIPLPFPGSFHLLGCFSQGPFRVIASLLLQAGHRHQHQTDLGSKFAMLPADCMFLDKSLCFSEHDALSYGRYTQLGHGVIGRQS